MKTRIIAIVFGVLISATAFAQRGDATPEERAEKMTARLTEKLELSEEQATEAKDIFLTHMKEGKEKAEEASTREDRMAVRKEQQAAIDKELKAVLSEAQIQQYEQLKADRKQGGGKQRAKGKRGRGQ